MRLSPSRKRTFIVTVLWCVGICGCVHDLPLRIDPARHARKPPKSAVLLFVDGLGNQEFDLRLARGEMPNVERYIVSRGLRFERTVSCVPSITYAVTSTLLTGRQPGHHGIVGNRWFDPYSLRYQDYAHIDTYRHADEDLLAPTIYQILDDQFTVSIQCATRQGVTRNIDNWATSGLNWFFGQILNVDKLVAMRFELIADVAGRTGRWPTFIFAYFPACDEIAHRYSTHSPQFARAVRNVDEQIGRICRALETAGLLDQTLLVFLADHGHAAIKPTGHFDLEEHLRSKYGLKVTHGKRNADRRYEKRFEYYERFDAVALCDGPRAAYLYFRPAGGHWYDRKPDVRRTPLHTTGRLTVQGLAERLAGHPAIRLIALRAGRGKALLMNRIGTALVSRIDTPGSTAPGTAPAATRSSRQPRRYRYRLLKGRDPLGMNLPALQRPDDPREVVLDSRQWLAVSVDSPNPDVVVQIVDLFDSPRAADMILFAEPGWGFDWDVRSGHGSTTPQEMLVPLIFCGPGIPAGKVTRKPARLEDVMPTIIAALGFERRLAAVCGIDGAVLRISDRAAKTDIARGQTGKILQP